jgi:hypothetical protein
VNRLTLNDFAQLIDVIDADARSRVPSPDGR